MALPSNVGKGTVKGRFIDSAGANIAGTITFTPTPKRLLNATALPSAVTILPKPVTVALTEGAFIQQLIATDDPDNNPEGWTYAVSFNFIEAKADPFAIEVPEGTEVDLTTVAPVGTGNGTMIVRGPGFPDITGGTDGQVIVLVDGQPAWGDATGGAPVEHSHAVGDVTGLQAALNGKQPAGSYATATHGHAIGNVTGLQDALTAAASTGPAPTLATLPAGSIHRVAYTAPSQARPTSRTDITVWWVGGPTTHPSNAISGDIHTPDMEG